MNPPLSKAMAESSHKYRSSNSQYYGYWTAAVKIYFYPQSITWSFFYSKVAAGFIPARIRGLQIKIPQFKFNFQPAREREGFDTSKKVFILAVTYTLIITEK